MPNNNPDSTFAAKKLVGLFEGGADGGYYLCVRELGNIKVETYEIIGQPLAVRIYNPARCPVRQQIAEAVLHSCPNDANAFHVGLEEKFDNSVCQQAREEVQIDGEFPVSRKIVHFLKIPEDIYKIAVKNAAEFMLSFEHPENVPSADSSDNR